MNKSQLKALGLAGLVLTAVLLFVAWERNNTNTNNVAAMNSFGASAMFGGGKMKPAMPASSKYALLFGALTAVGSLACLAASSKAAS